VAAKDGCFPAFFKYATHTWLDNLVGCNTNRIISIFVASPKVAKASKEGNIGLQYRRCFRQQASPM
jgi:hypothetical protein